MFQGLHWNSLATILLLVAGTATADDAPVKKIPPIPSRPVKVEEMVKEIANYAQRIEKPQERFRVLSSLLYDLKSLSSQQHRPVLDVLKDIADDVDAQTLIGSRESLILYAPRIAVQIALGSEDQRLKDLYLGDLVPRLAADDPKLALNLLAKIKESESRAKAILGYIKSAPVKFEQVRPMLEEVLTLDWTTYFRGACAVAIAEACAGFAPEHAREISQLLRKHQTPEEAISTLIRLSWILPHRLKSPQAAKDLNDEAINWLPRTENPSKSALWIIHSGYDQLTEKQAKSLFDEYILPSIAERKQATEYPLSLLANISMPLLVSRAKASAEALRRPLIEILPQAVGRAAHESDPGRVLAWLKSQPRSMLRAKCVVEVASTLRFRFPSNFIPHKTARRWLKTLTELASEIQDDSTKWLAYHFLLDVAADMDEPLDDLRREWWILLERLKQLPEPIHDRGFPTFDIFKFPLEEQEKALATELDPTPANKGFWKREGNDPSQTLERIEYSSLTDKKKAELYHRMAEQAKGDELVVSGIAHSLALTDFAEALKLLWNPKADKSQRTQKSGLPEKTSPAARVAVDWLHNGGFELPLKVRSREGVSLLWNLAHSVATADREPVLTVLVRGLIDREELERALGVASQIDSLPVRFKLMAEIAGRASLPAVAE